MKKTVEKVKKLQKLQLSRETLRALESSDAQKVLGGNQEWSVIGSCQSQCNGWPDNACG